MVAVAVEASRSLAERGIECGVANARFAKPLDCDLLRRVREKAARILTLEEHLAMGGFGSAVLEAFHLEGWDAANLRVHAIPDQFVDHSPALVQRAGFKLDPAGVVEMALALFPDLARAAAPGRGTDAGRRDNLVETVTW